MGHNKAEEAKFYVHRYEVAPEEVWREGWKVILRIRYLSITGLVKTGINVGIWKIFGTKFIVISVPFSIIIFLLLLILRKAVLYESLRDIDLHAITHYLRYALYDMLSLAIDYTDEHSIDGKKKLFFERYENFNNKCVNLIAQYYRNWIGDETINCAIRLADLDERDNFIYSTEARSEGLNNELRDKQTRPLKSDAGIARFFQRKKKLGVCIIKNIPSAINAEIWEESPNDKLEDIKTLMIAPINGALEQYGNGKYKKEMLGLIYITSKYNKFRLKHMNSLKAIADYLGTLYPLLLEYPEYLKEEN